MQEKKISKNLRIKKISIVGVIPSFAFQRAKYCALELHRKLPQKFPLPEIIGLLELDWSEKLLEWRQTLGREYWCLRRPVAVFFDDRFIGSDIELIKLASIGNILMESIPRKNMSFIKEHFRKDYITYLRKTKRIYCYLDICVDGRYVGTLTFQLYSDLLPRTCENFTSLCLGNRGPFLSYKGSRIHRIVKKGWLQGGDIQYKTGGGGFSIFCDPLEDECFGISHDRRGVLSMANGGRHLNGSQFFVTLKPSKWMDTHFVAFGQLMEGVKVLKILENLETSYECPIKKIEIKNCGKLDLEDVDDVDMKYRDEPYPKKKPKKIETISEQVVRLIMEALTNALARREYAPDILDDGDIPSKMNLQLYFQGFYSISEEILEDSARYLRNMRRQFLRVLKPSATEVVEVIMYDLLMAVLTRMTTLDDVRETLGYDLYQKMVNGIDMNLELCQKPYVKRLVDQIVTTAESMVSLITRKMVNLKKLFKKTKKFQESMQNWVQSFVLQETFQGDNYHISDRPSWNIVDKKSEKQKNKQEEEKEKKQPKREGIPCCEMEEKEKDKADLEKLKQKYPPEDICCLGSKIFEQSEIRLTDYFKLCRYDLKRVPKPPKERMPLLDLIEISRFKLKWMRKQENRQKGKERLCLEKKIRKWMQEVVYTPETSWIQDIVYGKEDEVFDHIEEIMYGAMTAGLLEMYYFMEEYLKLCGGKKQRFVTRIIYPEDSESVLGESASKTGEIEGKEEGEGDGEGEGEGKEEEEEAEPVPPLPACTCGHPCCVCPFDPHFHAPPPPPSLEEEGEGGDLGEESEKQPSTIEAEPRSEVNPCGSDMELVDLNALLAEKTSMKPEEIDIRSFRWLKPYILEEGCDMKTEFATQVHKWLDGERFNYNGFISKHSLVTRASLLSLSISLAELIKEENEMKSEIKDFIYDLWDLYFNEMFKEALLEFPPEEESEKKEETEKEEEEREEEEEEGGGEKSEDDECKKIIAQTPDFDFTTFCARVKSGSNEEENDESSESERNFDNKEELEERKPEPHKVVPEPEPKPQKVAPKPEPEPEKAAPKPEPEPTVAPPNLETSIEQIPAVPMSVTSVRDMEQFQPKMHSTPKKVKPAPAEKTQEGSIEESIEEIEVIKKKRSPYEIHELVDEPSSDESRQMPPYVLPFWVKFLTELTKQALGTIAKVSRLPRRLYFLSDADVDFDDKMKEWFEFNAFNPVATKGREVKDFIALQHKSLTNLEDTARSYLKKKKYSQLLNRCTRITSADDMADEIVTDVIANAMKQSDEEPETLELFISHLVSSAVASTSNRSETSQDEEEYTLKTDERSYQSAVDEFQD